MKPFVVVIALNSFEKMFGGSEHQFNLVLKSNHLASLANLDKAINHPERQLDEIFKRQNPLAGYYLESFLKVRGYSVQTLFNWTGPRELERLLANDPIAVLLSTTYITDNNMLRDCIRSIKDVIGAVPLVVGGPYIWKHQLELSDGYHASGHGSSNDLSEPVPAPEFLARAGVDPVSDNLFATPHAGPLRSAIYVAAEFGEHTVLKVLEKLNDGADIAQLGSIPNLVLPIGQTWRHTAKTPEPVDLNADYTRWDLIDEMPFMVPMRTSVGCPFRCRFCDFIELHPKVTMRSVQSIASEIKCAQRRGAMIFHFVDDNIFLTKKRIAELTATISTLGVSWGGFFRVDRIDESNVQGLRKSGCRFGLCGIETADPKMLTLMRKGCRLEEIRTGISLCSDVGIGLNLSFIVGFPGENLQTMDNTVAFINSLPTNNRGVTSYQLYPFYLLPSTNADSAEFRADHGLVGRYASWRHDTMSYQDVVDQWAPYMFRRINALPYQYYGHDAPFHWNIEKRNQGFEARRKLTIAFLDNQGNKEIQTRFAELFSVVASNIGRPVPGWRSVIADRPNQPGIRKPLERLGG